MSFTPRVHRDAPSYTSPDHIVGIRLRGTPHGRFADGIRRRQRNPGRDRLGRTRSPKLRYIRSEEHPSELQSLLRISYAVFCLKKKKHIHNTPYTTKKSH